MTLLDGLKVLDVAEGIAGPYCTKLLADAGADVVKVETKAGDPLRGWSAGNTDLHGADGALFQFLNASKRAVAIGPRAAVGPNDPEMRRLLPGADVLVESGQLSDAGLASTLRDFPQLTIVSITPFGRTGPWASRPATEFTLQALCGSTGRRGTLDREPVHAGGRIGEWAGGVYGAVGALAGVRAARASAAAEHVDVSILECMAITMGGYGSLNAAMRRSRPEGPSRTVEVPSIEPTADGYVGFCTITGQQFRDFLVLIEHPELTEDADLASMNGRQRRREQFLRTVWEWTTKRSTGEIIERASLMRIPVAPIGTPETLCGFDHFVERGVFVRSPGGDFVHPRPPYLVDEAPGRSFGPAPAIGEHDGAVEWPARRPARAPAADRHPLGGIRIVDLTAFWAGPAATQMLAALGADVVKVESAQRPDGMRFSSTRRPTEDGWWEWSPIFQAVNVNKRGVTLDLTSARGRELLLELISHSDAVVENFSPRVLDNFGITWPAIHRCNPRSIMVRMPAFGLSGPWRDRTGFAQTMEQVSGMAWMTGFADGPPMIPRGPCDPLAGMHAAFSLIAALEERERSGRGHFVEVTMVEAALNMAAELVIEHSAYGTSLARDGNRGPGAAPQGLYPCLGADQWLALAVATDDQWVALTAALGDPGWAASSELSGSAGRRAAHDHIDQHLRQWTAGRDVETVVEDLVSRGIPAARVVEGDRVLECPQLRARGFVETIEHRLVGDHEVDGVPFRLSSHPGPWFHHAAPMLGEHNVEVLRTVLGLSDEELDRLAADNVIGTRLGGGIAPA